MSVGWTYTACVGYRAVLNQKNRMAELWAPVPDWVHPSSAPEFNSWPHELICKPGRTAAHHMETFWGLNDTKCPEHCLALDKTPQIDGSLCVVWELQGLHAVQCTGSPTLDWTETELVTLPRLLRAKQWTGLHACSNNNFGERAVTTAPAPLSYECDKLPWRIPTC